MALFSRLVRKVHGNGTEGVVIMEAQRTVLPAYFRQLTVVCHNFGARCAAGPDAFQQLHGGSRWSAVGRLHMPLPPLQMPTGPGTAPRHREPLPSVGAPRLTTPVCRPSGVFSCERFLSGGRVISASGGKESLASFSLF